MENIDIRHYLPHREPMLMVDSILEIGDGKVVTSFKIIENNIFLNAKHQLAEVGLIENMAQTCSAIVGQDIFENSDAQTKVIGFITNIKKIDIFKQVSVDDEIITKAELVSQFGDICNINCKTFFNGNIIAEGEINLFIKEMES